ncbi:MAG TPA: nuclear transport factor 2 family protein [Thermoleophilaceae bacterium]|nr:nuclear transport factor 2 family protein [Thermoleophilaceae bacterium]
MTGERAEVVRRAHDALNAGDVDGLIALCSPGFRLDMSDRVFNPAVYEGAEGIRAFYAEVLEVWERFSWEPIGLTEVDDTIVADLRSRGLTRGSAMEIDRRCAMVWRVEDGRATSLTFFRDPDAAREAAAGY